MKRFTVPIERLHVRRDIVSFAVLFAIGILAGTMLATTTGVGAGQGVAAGPLAEDDAGFRGSTATPSRSPAEDVVAVDNTERRDRTGLRRAPVRLSRSAPGTPPPPQRAPKIAIVIDDLGLSWDTFDAVNRLPPPVTLAFLPYGRDVQAMMDAIKAGHDAIVHMPMEAIDPEADTGPGALRTGQSRASLKTQIAETLGSLRGFSGINNHTGSRFTSDAAAMRVLLADLRGRGLFFLDSWTTPEPVAHRLAGPMGASVVRRDVFLDPDYRTLTAESVRTQLTEAEEIAREKGYAIVIGHPYRTTLTTLEDWLATAEDRGFDVVRVKDLAPAVDVPAYARLR